MRVLASAIIFALLLTAAFAGAHGHGLTDGKVGDRSCVACQVQHTPAEAPLPVVRILTVQRVLEVAEPRAWKAPAFFEPLSHAPKQGPPLHS